MQSHQILFDPIDSGTLGFPVPQHLLEFAQVHVNCISVAIQPPHPLMPSTPGLSASWHQVFSNELVVRLS